jgi:hypothetical protein
VSLFKGNKEINTSPPALSMMRAPGKGGSFTNRIVYCEC